MVLSCRCRCCFAFCARVLLETTLVRGVSSHDRTVDVALHTTHRDSPLIEIMPPPSISLALMIAVLVIAQACSDRPSVLLLLQATRTCRSVRYIIPSARRRPTSIGQHFPQAEGTSRQTPLYFVRHNDFCLFCLVDCRALPFRTQKGCQGACRGASNSQGAAKHQRDRDFGCPCGGTELTGQERSAGA